MKFNNQFKKLIEAIEIGQNYPRGFYHPSNLAQDQTVEDYKHMLYSQNYEKTLDRLAQYANVPVQNLGNYPMTRVVVDLLQRIKRIETQNKTKLEEMAVKLVLNLDEMKPIREAIKDGVLKIDAKLESAELQDAITDLEAQTREEELKDEEGNPVVESDELTDQEKVNIALAMEIMGEEEIKQRKSFADVLKFGESFNHLYSYSLVRDQLNEINPELANMYGIASSIVQVLYYSTPTEYAGQAAQSPESSLGSAQAESEGGERGEEGEGKYVIKARAITFSFLVHEIVKGVMQYVSMMDELRNVEKTASLEDESRTMRFAQAQLQRVLSLIPEPFVKHKYYIYQQLMRLPIEDLKEVQQNGLRAKDIVKEIIDEMVQEFNLDPETGEEKEEEYKDQE